jgi:hypothetical protein
MTLFDWNYSKSCISRLQRIVCIPALLAATISFIVSEINQSSPIFRRIISINIKIIIKNFDTVILKTLKLTYLLLFEVLQLIYFIEIQN